jgi:type I restriction enzyme, S subunit
VHARGAGAEVRLVLDSPASRARLESLAASSAGQYNLSLGKLDFLPIPLPPIEVQRVALAALSEPIGRLRRLERDVAAASARSNLLRRALLEAAFSGRLTGASGDTEVVEKLADALPTSSA